MSDVSRKNPYDRPNARDRQIYSIPAPGGLLFIGDPHCSPNRPTRRTERNWIETSTNRLMQSVEIAREHQAMPVILGDLFDKPRFEGSKEQVRAGYITVNRVIDLLAKSPIIPVINEGNHDKQDLFRETTDEVAIANSADTAIDMISAARVALVMNQPGFVAVVETANGKILLGGTPYGFPIPHEVDLVGAPEHDLVCWLTHHDLAFAGSYPGASELVEIKGVDLAANGHMHKAAPPVRRGSTLFVNPGNILRLSKDLRNEKPSVWLWDGSPIRSDAFEGGVLQRILLDAPSGDVAFDLTGDLVEAAHPLQGVGDLTGSRESVFAALLSRSDGASISQGDGSGFAEVLVTTLAEKPKATRDLMFLFAEQAGVKLSPEQQRLLQEPKGETDELDPQGDGFDPDGFEPISVPELIDQPDLVDQMEQSP